jgi:RimJ/RimL family protein N-acetyltransferase
VSAPAPVAGLTLRPWHDDDAAALIAAAGDPLLERWTRVRVATPEAAEQWLQVQHRGRERGDRFSFAAVDGDGTLVGNVALKRPDPAADEAEVGYWTAAYARGRGIAPQALGALTTWSFASFGGLRRLCLLHQVDNTGSCRVAEKSGYAHAETLPPYGPYPREGHLHLYHRPDHVGIATAG